jgi:hypothetical protein
MGSRRNSYTPHPTSAEVKLDVLASVYKFILDRASTRDRALNSGPDDAAKETKHGCDATESIRQ